MRQCLRTYVHVSVFYTLKSDRYAVILAYASVLLVEVRSHVYTLSIVPFFSLELSSFLLFCPLSLFLPMVTG